MAQAMHLARVGGLALRPLAPACPSCLPLNRDALPARRARSLRGEPMTVQGEGQQTRSLCYVEDEIRGFLALMESDYYLPVNIGNPDEVTMRYLNVDFEIMARLAKRQHDGEMDKIWTDRQVWKRLAA